jgi:hypothetical protein
VLQCHLQRPPVAESMHDLSMNAEALTAPRKESIMCKPSTNVSRTHERATQVIIRALAVLLVASTGLGNIAAGQSDRFLYYITNHASSVFRLQLNQPDQQPVCWGMPYANDLAVHDCKMYWTAESTVPNQGTIWRSDMDGADKEELVPIGFGEPPAIAIDPVAGHFYWSANPGGNTVIRRADLDGSNIQPVLSLANSASILSLSLDLASRKLYWTETFSTGIRRANLDGSNIEDVVVPAVVARMVLDLSAGKIYWSEILPDDDDLIRRANLDGTNVENVLTGLDLPTELAVDSESARIYWREAAANTIRSANLDGSQIIDIVDEVHALGFTWVSANVDEVCGPPDPCPPKMDCSAVEAVYWCIGSSNPIPGKIWRANADGTGIHVIVTLAGLWDLYAVALDREGGKVYWTQTPTTNNADAVHVFRANLEDGSNVEPLINLPHMPGAYVSGGIALDVLAGKMYFSRQRDPTPDRNRIYRSNLDGTNIEIFHTSAAADSATQLHLDSGQNKLYFRNASQIVRVTTIAGLQPPVEPLVTPAATFSIIDTDLPEGKLYWFQSAASPLTAMRSNLDGSNVEQLGSIGVISSRFIIRHWML